MNQNNSQPPIVVDFAKMKPRSPEADERSPLLSSYGQGWKNLSFNYFRYGKCETSVHVLPDHAVGLILDRGQVERRLGSVYRLESASVGSVAIIPAQVEHWSAWNVIGRFAMLSLPPQAIAQIDPNTVNPDLIELIPTFATSQPDPLIHGIGIAIKRYLETEAQDNGFYIEHLTNALAAHLLQNYCTRKIRLPEYSDGLSTSKLERAIEYINDNLDRGIKLENIAHELDISQYYFSHLFRESMGISPYQYIIQQRVARVKLLLNHTSMSLVEIALACGFSSQSQMTMHFRKATGTTPKKYRNQS
ncbi:MAG: AraC family transcriptional regulator [Cyanobacteria bacterium J06635_13]